MKHSYLGMRTDGEVTGHRSQVELDMGRTHACREGRKLDRGCVAGLKSQDQLIYSMA